MTTHAAPLSDKRPSSWAWLGLLALGALLYLPNLGAYDLWAPDEPRFGQVAREMIASGDWIVPRVNNEVYTDKPPLYFWIIALLALLKGEVTPFIGRLPSALAGIGGILATYGIGRRLFNRRTGVLGAVILSVSFIYIFQARVAQLDMLLSFFCILAIWAFVVCYTSDARRPVAAMVFWAAMALGTLSKGPPCFIVVLGTVLVFLGVRRELRQFRKLYPLVGLLVFAGLLFAWLIPMNLSIPKEKSQNLLLVQTLQRYFAAESHNEPWFYYLERIPSSFMPWILFLPSALYVLWPRRTEPLSRESLRRPIRWAIVSIVALAVLVGGLTAAYRFGDFEAETYETIQVLRIASAWLIIFPWLWFAMWRLIRRFERPELQLMLAWVLFTVLFFTPSSGKRDQYLLPMYPALALLVGAFWEPYIAGAKPFEKKLWIPALPLAIALAVAAIVAQSAYGKYAAFGVAARLYIDLLWIRLILGVLAVAIGGSILARRPRLLFASTAAVLAVGILYAAFVLFPANNHIKSGRRLCEAIDAERRPDDRVMTLDIFREEYIFFGDYFVEELKETSDAARAMCEPRRVFCITYSEKTDDVRKVAGVPVYVLWRNYVGSRRMVILSNRPSRLPHLRPSMQAQKGS